MTFASVIAVMGSLAIALQGCGGGGSTPSPSPKAAPLNKTVTIAPGVEMTTVNLGTCCGSDPKVGLGPWLKAGGVGIDTAYDYFDQPAIGAILKSLNISRSSVFITSKIPAGNGNSSDCSEDPSVAASVAMNYAKENLKELGVDYVDLLLLHSPCQEHNHKKPVKNATASNAALWAGMVQVLKMNLTRAIGVSNYNSTNLDALPMPVPSVNQCNMGVSKHDDATITYCQKKGILYEAYGVMHSCPFNNTGLASIAAAHNRSVSQVCERYVLDKGVAMALGTGSNATKAPKEAAENLDVYGFHLTADEFKTVDAMQKSETVNVIV